MSWSRAAPSRVVVVALSLALACGFVACKKDDDEEVDAQATPADETGGVGASGTTATTENLPPMSSEYTTTEMGTESLGAVPPMGSDLASSDRDGGQADAPGGTAVAGAGNLQVGTMLGCFKDSNSPFDLGGTVEADEANTPQRCIAKCAATGYRYAGVQYAHSCLCGNQYGTQGTADNCNMACSGDPNQVCGGYYSNNVYVAKASPVAQ